MCTPHRTIAIACLWDLRLRVGTAVKPSNARQPLRRPASVVERVRLRARGALDHAMGALRAPRSFDRRLRSRLIRRVSAHLGRRFLELGDPVMSRPRGPPPAWRAPHVAPRGDVRRAPSWKVSHASIAAARSSAAATISCSASMRAWPTAPRALRSSRGQRPRSRPRAGAPADRAGRGAGRGCACWPAVGLRWGSGACTVAGSDDMPAGRRSASSGKRSRGAGICTLPRRIDNSRNSRVVTARVLRSSHPANSEATTPEGKTNT